MTISVAFCADETTDATETTAAAESTAAEGLNAFILNVIFF